MDIKLAIDQLKKRKTIYAIQISKLTGASEYEMINLEKLTRDRLKEIMAHENLECRIIEIQSLINLLGGINE